MLQKAEEAEAGTGIGRKQSDLTRPYPSLATSLPTVAMIATVAPSGWAPLGSRVILPSPMDYGT